MQCPYCASTTMQRKKGRNVNNLQIYYCAGCRKKYTEGIPVRPKKVVEVKNCPNCGKETTNPQFCSRSCAASYTNKVSPKRKGKPHYCKYCGVPISRHRLKCENCVSAQSVDWSQRTIGDIQKAAKYQVSAQVRDFARQEYAKSGRPYVCHNCGYEKHVEICHIEAINRFPPETLVAVVSGIDNLIALCPNCHWEFDNDLLHLG